MYHPSIAYILYWFRSTNQYGVHSPFVYDLMTKRNKKIPLEKTSCIKNLRQQLYSNDQQIDVSDFGAGSRIFKTNVRQVGKIAKTAGISRFWGKKLFSIVNYLQPTNVLELGTSVGLSTAYISAANPKMQLTSIEGCKSTHRVAQSTLEEWPYGELDLIQGSFDEKLDSFDTNRRFDMIYFDGHHAKEPTLRYFEKCLSLANESSVFFFDDIYWSIEMQEAWKQMIEHPKVTLSIDCYKWGLLFFRTEQLKQHFVLRM